MNKFKPSSVIKNSEVVQGSVKIIDNELMKKYI